MASLYRVQIVDSDGVVVQAWEPGGVAERELIENLGARVAGKGLNAQLRSWQPHESDVIDAIARKVADKGVGLGRTTTHVIADVKDAIAEVLSEIRLARGPSRESTSIVEDVKAAVRELLYDVKASARAPKL